MPRTSIALLPLLLVALPAQTDTPSGEQTNEIAWQTDLGAARKLAAEKKAPLLVVFRCER